MQTFRIALPPCEVVRCESAAALATAVAADLQSLVASQGSAARPFCIALSGGRIAADFFQAAAAAWAASKPNLSHIHFFWADERCVPPDDAESNYRLARERLIEPLHISPANVHRIRGESHPSEAAAAAERELRAVCREHGRAVGLDLVLLGMGEDGHVASLFPGEPAEAVNSPAMYRAVVAVKPPAHRVTLGYPLLQDAGAVWVLISGMGKEAALRTSLRPEPWTPLGRVLHSRVESRIYAEQALIAPTQGGFGAAKPA